MTSIRAALVLCAALFLASCLPVTTSTPVGSTAGFKADSELYGAWLGRDADPAKDKDSGAVYFHFLASKDGSMTLILVTSAKSGDDAGEWSVFRLQPATLGQNHFLNVQEVSNNGEAPEDALLKTFPVLYRMGKDGKLTLYLVDEDLAKAAIKAGKINGEIEPGDTGDVHITADAATLDAFFVSARGTALFTKPLVVLKRVP